jgi:PST family polysaccharide transporter
VKNTTGARHGSVGNEPVAYRRVVVRGLGWVSGLQVITAVASQLTNVVLAVLLSPADFGMFALAMIAVAFVAIPGDLGLTVALIQRKDVEDTLATGLRLRWLIAVVLTAAMLAGAPAFSWLFQSPSTLTMLVVLAAIFPGAAFGFASRVLLTRKLDFQSIAISDLIGRLTGLGISITLALMNFGFWSLVTGFVASQWISSIAIFALQPVGYNGRYRPDIARSLVSLGKYVSFATLLGYFLFTADNAIVASAFGVVALGYYSLSYSFAVTIPRNIASMVETVVFPIYSKIAADQARLRKAYLMTTRYVAYFAVPVAMVFVVFSPLFVELVLGPKWYPASLPMQILGIAGFLYSLAVPSSALLNGAGRTSRVAIATGAGVAVLLAGLALAYVFHSFELIALAAVCGAAGYATTLLWQVKHFMGLEVKVMVELTLRPLLAATIASVPALILMTLGPASILVFLTAAGATGVTLVITSELLSRGDFLHSIRELASLLVH